MRYSKIAVSIPTEFLIKLDRLVKEKRFPSRSSAIQKSIEDELKLIEKTSLAYACDLLDADEEKALAEEGMDADMKDWLKCKYWGVMLSGHTLNPLKAMSNKELDLFLS